MMPLTTVELTNPRMLLSDRSADHTSLAASINKSRDMGSLVHYSENDTLIYWRCKKTIKASFARRDSSS